MHVVKRVLNERLHANQLSVVADHVLQGCLECRISVIEIDGKGGKKIGRVLGSTDCLEQRNTRSSDAPYAETCMPPHVRFTTCQSLLAQKASTLGVEGSGSFTQSIIASRDPRPYGRSRSCMSIPTSRHYEVDKRTTWWVLTYRDYRDVCLCQWILPQRGCVSRFPQR